MVLHYEGLQKNPSIFVLTTDSIKTREKQLNMTIFEEWFHSDPADISFNYKGYGLNERILLMPSKMMVDLVGREFIEML